MDLKLSLYDAGKPTRMRHKHSTRRRYLLIYTREVNGKDAGFDVFFSRNSNVGGTEFEILYPVDFLKK
jgi:hypothetical protein